MRMEMDFLGREREGKKVRMMGVRVVGAQGASTLSVWGSGEKGKKREREKREKGWMRGVDDNKDRVWVRVQGAEPNQKETKSTVRNE